MKNVTISELNQSIAEYAFNAATLEQVLAPLNLTENDEAIKIVKEAAEEYISVESDEEGATAHQEELMETILNNAAEELLAIQ